MTNTAFLTVGYLTLPGWLVPHAQHSPYGLVGMIPSRGQDSDDDSFGGYMAKNTKRSVATWVSAAMAVSGLLLGAGLLQMLTYMSEWTASEAGSIYDLILTGLVALSFMVFGVGIVVLAYVSYRVSTDSK